VKGNQPNDDTKKVRFWILSPLRYSIRLEKATSTDRKHEQGKKKETKENGGISSEKDPSFLQGSFSQTERS